MTEILTDLNTPNVLNAIQHNAYAFFIRRERLLGKAVSEESGITWIEGPAAVPVAWLRDFGTRDGAACRSQQAAVRFALRGLSDVFVVLMETGDCRAAWQACGAVCIETQHVMVAILPGKLDDRVHVRGLTIEHIEDDRGLRDCAAVISAGRDQWAAGYFQLTNPALSSGPDRLHYYLARLNGSPVATAVQFFCGGVGGVWWVTTVPEVRSRGVATGITRAAMADAARMGFRAVMVEVMPDSVPRYRRLGFHEYCRINVYRWRSSGERR